MFPKKHKPDWHTLEFGIKWWKAGDPVPQFGKALGIDTETELITDTCQVPPLVVTGCYNPFDNTCYLVDYKNTQAFMHEILTRDSIIYLANAGFDYFELWSKELQQAASDRRIIDLLIRAPFKEIATIGYIRSLSLKAACKWHLKYAMNKHEEEGEASVRLNFRQNKPVTEEAAKYLALDCVTTYLASEAIGPQATEDTHTLGHIVLTHIRNNGMPVDQEMFDCCEALLKKDMEVYRQQLIQFGFPDPLKKKEKTEMELLEESWRVYIGAFFRKFYDESYNIPYAVPGKTTCKRLILYGMAALHHNEERTSVARLLTALLAQNKNGLTKAETAGWNELTEELDFLVPCDVSKKREVWPILLKRFLDAFSEGKDFEGIKDGLEEVYEGHPEWFTKEETIKPKAFIQEKLKQLEREHPGLQFARTPKSGDLKCSKKDAWILRDFGVHDAFLECYNNFVHVQKYLSTFCNREHIKADGKAHARYGIVATGRTSCTGPNLQQLPSHDKRLPLRNMFKPPVGTVLVSTDYSFLRSCIKKVNCWNLL